MTLIRITTIEEPFDDPSTVRSAVSFLSRAEAMGFLGDQDIDHLGIATVYRAPGRACYVFNSSVANHIETFQDGEGRFYFTSVGQGEQTFGSRTFETEAMNDNGSSAYSCLYGDWRGYAIVERLGLAIVRFQDSATGINKVEFHLRRRIGGAVIEPYRFAVLQCAA